MTEWKPRTQDADQAAAGLRVRDELNALTTLGFWTPPDHPAHERARELDKHLLPVRRCAGEAFGALPRRDRPMSGEALAGARAALVECWKLVDVAAGTIDTAGWLLGPGGTRGWAERHVERGLEAVARRGDALKKVPPNSGAA